MLTVMIQRSWIRGGASKRGERQPPLARKRSVTRMPWEPVYADEAFESDSEEGSESGEESGPEDENED